MVPILNLVDIAAQVKFEQNAILMGIKAWYIGSQVKFKQNATLMEIKTQDKLTDMPVTAWIRLP